MLFGVGVLFFQRVFLHSNLQHKLKQSSVQTISYFYLVLCFSERKGEPAVGKTERCTLVKSLFQCESYKVLSMLLVKCIALACCSACGVQQSKDNK